MEVGKIPASLPSLTRINKEIKDLVDSNIKYQLQLILSDIADKYRISKNELFQNYLSDIVVIKPEIEDTSSKKRIRKKIPQHLRCSALTSTHDQCSRKRKDDHQFCGSHLNSRNFGVVKST